MTGFTCGLWPARRREHANSLVAVVVDEEGRAQTPPLFIERSDEGAWSLLTHLEMEVGLDFALALPDYLARSGPLAHFALERGYSAWLVPGTIIEAVRIVANLATGPPARTAAALARLPLAPVLRGYLRRLTPPPKNQLPLL
jgi:hypothetical protein